MTYAKHVVICVCGIPSKPVHQWHNILHRMNCSPEKVVVQHEFLLGLLKVWMGSPVFG